VYHITVTCKGGIPVRQVIISVETPYADSFAGLLEKNLLQPAPITRSSREDGRTWFCLSNVHVKAENQAVQLASKLQADVTNPYGSVRCMRITS